MAISKGGKSNTLQQASIIKEYPEFIVFLAEKIRTFLEKSAEQEELHLTIKTMSNAPNASNALNLSNSFGYEIFIVNQGTNLPKIYTIRKPFQNQLVEMTFRKPLPENMNQLQIEEYLEELGIIDALNKTDIGSVAFKVNMLSWSLSLGKEPELEEMGMQVLSSGNALNPPKRAGRGRSKVRK